MWGGIQSLTRQKARLPPGGHGGNGAQIGTDGAGSGDFPEASKLVPPSHVQ